jgi:hypothetical protein
VAAARQLRRLRQRESATLAAAWRWRQQDSANNQPVQQKDKRADTLCGRGWPREMCKGFLQFYILAKKKIFSVISNLLVFLLCY